MLQLAEFDHRTFNDFKNVGLNEDRAFSRNLTSWRKSKCFRRPF